MSSLLIELVAPRLRISFENLEEKVRKVIDELWCLPINLSSDSQRTHFQILYKSSLDPGAISQTDLTLDSPSNSTDCLLMIQALEKLGIHFIKKTIPLLCKGVFLNVEISSQPRLKFCRKCRNDDAIFNKSSRAWSDTYRLLLDSVWQKGLWRHFWKYCQTITLKWPMLMRQSPWRAVQLQTFRIDSRSLSQFASSLLLAFADKKGMFSVKHLQK